MYISTMFYAFAAYALVAGAIFIAVAWKTKSEAGFDQPKRLSPNTDIPT